MEVLPSLLWSDLKGHACFWIEGLLCKEGAMLCPLPLHIFSQLKCNPASTGVR